MAGERVKAILKRLLGRRHPEIYDALKAYARKKGMRVDDVIAAAVATYLSMDDEGKEELEMAIQQLKAKAQAQNPYSPEAIKSALQLFKDVMEITVDAMTKVQGAAQQLVRNSLINELRSNMEMVKEIKQLGEEGGKGSLDDIIAQAFLGAMMSRLGANQLVGLASPSRGKRVKAGTGKVEQLEPE